MTSDNSHQAGPTSTRVRQDRRIRQLLLELEMISHGTITAYNSSGGAHGKSERAYPPGELAPPHIRFRDAYNAAGSDRKRFEVITAASDELKSLRRRPISPVGNMSDRQVIERRIFDEGTGWTADDVARALNTTAGVVRKTRLRNGRNPDDGHPLDLSASERASIAAKMAAEGVSQEQIAKRLDVSQPTVSRLLRTRKIAA